MSAIKEAYIMFNGQKVVAQYDESTKTWTATTNAPANSSWSQPDHVYKVEIHAVDTANNEATMTSADPIITDVVAEATTVDSGGTIKITFKVTDAA